MSTIQLSDYWTNSPFASDKGPTMAIKQGLLRRPRTESTLTFNGGQPSAYSSPEAIALLYEAIIAQQIEDL
jgi:hypothetical protein